MDVDWDFGKVGEMSFRDAHPVDYWATLVGISMVALFCLFLFLLIRSARRRVPADAWLSYTVFSWFLLCGYAFVRLIQDRVYIEYISTALWLFAMFCIIGTTYHMRKEKLLYGRERDAERRRLLQQIER